MALPFDDIFSASASANRGVLLSERTQLMALKLLEIAEFRSNWDEMSDSDWDTLESAIGAAMSEILVEIEGGGSVTSYAIWADVKTNGTAGGSASATTYNARNLNTPIIDIDGLVSVSSNQFTPIANKYRIRASAPAFKTGSHRLRLYNVTQSTVVTEGENARSGSGNDTVTHAYIECEFEANGTDAYRIDHYTTVAAATNGLGVQLANGNPETYLKIYLEVIP